LKIIISYFLILCVLAMNIRQKLSADDMRDRIIGVAEEHFRRIGYGKTAVADIAAAMGMSPANIYRFFASKSAINDAICAKMMHEIDMIMIDLLARPLEPALKLQTFFLTLHRHNKDKLTHEHRLHDMVEVAMAENWPAISAHCSSMVGFLARIIDEGVRSGTFRAVDPAEFAQTAFDSCAKIIHPTLIAHCSHCADQDQEDQARRLTDLLLAALRPSIVRP
jgi:AcrR family transcriptional regulator